MFSYNMGGVPEYKLIPIEDIDYNIPYLFADQSCVVIKEFRDDGYIVFDLKDGDINVYCGDLSELIEKYAGAALVYPNSAVSVSLNLAINGGDDAN